MHLVRGPDIEVENRDIFFRAILNMLQSYRGYQIPPKLGYDAFVSLLSLWSRIIDANSFAIEVPIIRRCCCSAEDSLCTKGQVTASSSDGIQLLDDERSQRLWDDDNDRAVLAATRQIGTAVYGVSSLVLF